MVRMGQWANGCLEKEGLARLTISILVITTAGCLAYTWGYAEGVHNARTVIQPSHAATPVVFHASEVKLGEPLQHLGDNGTYIQNSKRIHTRRRTRKSPEDGLPALPIESSEQAVTADTAGG